MTQQLRLVTTLLLIIAIGYVSGFQMGSAPIFDRHNFAPDDYMWEEKRLGPYFYPLHHRFGAPGILRSNKRLESFDNLKKRIERKKGGHLRVLYL